MEFGFASFKSEASLRHPDGDSQKVTDRDSGIGMETRTEIQAGIVDWATRCPLFTAGTN